MPRTAAEVTPRAGHALPWSPVCGRFVSSSTPDELARYFGAAPPDPAPSVAAPPDSREPNRAERGDGRADDEANYNVAPSTDVYVVYESNRERNRARNPDRAGSEGVVRLLDRFHWGLVPSWAKDVSVG